MSIFSIFKKGKKNEEPEASATSTTATPVEEKPEASAAATTAATTAAATDQKPEASASGSAEGEQTSGRSYNLIILDESGSMSSIYMAAITGLNETLQTIRAAGKENPNLEQFVSLVTFNSNGYHQIYDCVPGDKAQDITGDQYIPSSGTPLFDAMGRGINELRKRVSKDDSVLVTIITDGYENASREYSLKAVESLVKEMQGQGWVFTYIGANQDVLEVSKSMGIDNFLAFDANMEGTRNMFAQEAACRANYYRRRAKLKDNSDFGKDFFKG